MVESAPVIARKRQARWPNSPSGSWGSWLGPHYRPMTLKAMSRQLEVDGGCLPGVSADRQGPDSRRESFDVAKDKTLSLPDRSGHDRGAIPALGQRLRIRSPAPMPPAESTRCTSRLRPPATRRLATRSPSRSPGRARRGGLSAEGQIVEVLTRAAAVFVGTYFEAGATSFVKVDGTTFNEPISVGDPGAKGARPGDKVVIEIVQYPSPYREGEGVIVEVLGPHGQPGVDTLSVIRAFNIPDTFDEAVLEEAREQARLFDEAADRLAGGLARASNRDDRPGERARLRRCDLAFARRKGALEPWRPYCRRRPLRSLGIGAGPRCPGPGNECVPAGPRDSDASGNPLERPGESSGRPNPVHRERASGLQP